MTKTTAQKLWEEIEEEINLVYYDDKHGEGGCLLNHIKLYAQTYHEEQMRDFVGIPVGEFNTYVLNKEYPGGVFLKTYNPNQPAQ